jgi:hypothetical protein
LPVRPVELREWRREWSLALRVQRLLEPKPGVSPQVSQPERWQALRRELAQAPQLARISLPEPQFRPVL